MTDTAATTTPDLHITRTFDAPRELVFQAWAKEEHLLNWFGPRTFPVVSWTHEFRTGGRFEYVMQGPEGVRAPGSGEYLEIVENERIVTQSQIVHEGDVIFEVRQVSTFEEVDGATRYTLDAYVLIDKDFPGRAGMEQGWNETLDRLGEHLATHA